MARLAQATAIIEASDTSGSLHQAVESVSVGHSVFIAGAVLDNPKLTWPARFMGPDKPLGRELRSSQAVIDFVSCPACRAAASTATPTSRSARTR